MVGTIGTSFYASNARRCSGARLRAHHSSNPSSNRFEPTAQRITSDDHEKSAKNDGQDAHDLDNVTYNLAVVVALLAVGSVLLFRVKLGTPRGVGARPRPSVTLRGWGVPLRRVKSALRELKRKTFHLCGLLVPLIHLALLEGGFRQRTCILMAWAITCIGWSADLARLHIPFVARHWPLQTILRDHEHEQLTGGCYFSLGCTLAMTVWFGALFTFDLRARSVSDAVAVMA